MAESNLLTDEIQNRLQQLAKNWDELRQKAAERGQRLEESLTYQQFAASIEEEEAWIMEKQHLLSGDDCGDTLAAVQGLLKKHGAFETDFKVHEDRCTEITGEGDKLIEAVSTVSLLALAIMQYYFFRCVVFLFFNDVSVSVESVSQLTCIFNLIILVTLRGIGQVLVSVIFSIVMKLMTLAGRSHIGYTLP